ncbi:MAG: T9SS type A sorting domain-containing protein [Flavobacteriales bacterium]|nr:T9SS type A sorting domain-containing protein [Flavobacteriales bacterium]
MRRIFTIAMVLLSSAHCYAQFSQGPFSSSNAYVSIVGGSLASWQNLDSIYVSDNARVSLTANLSTNGSYSNFLVVDGFNFSIPLGVNIDGIQVDVERSDGNGLSKDNIVRMVGASGNILTADRAKAAAWTATDTYLSYGSSSDTWGRTWVPYEINDPDYGFALSVQRTGGGAQVTLSQIDHIRMTVWYSAFVLPIELLYFNADLIDERVLLKWATATETNNSHFIIERASEDGVFSEIETIASGVDDKNRETAYGYLDKMPLDGVSYYRLKQVDLNGQQETFESVYIDRRTKDGANNTALNINGMLIPFDDLTFKPSDLEIYGMDGALIHRYGVTDFNSINLNVQSGVYLVRMYNGMEHASQKVFIP